MKKIYYFCLICFCFMMMACGNQSLNIQSQIANENMDSWKTVLEEKMPLIGHRNWIVVTDMAYPLQTNPGIITLFAPEPYEQVIAKVSGMIKKAPHIFAHVYQDKEQLALSEDLAKGWNAYKEQLGKVLDQKEVTYLPHEELILKLDEISKLYQVIIIKTSLTIPYTSTFFELDCNYWDAEREAAIRK